MKFCTVKELKLLFSVQNFTVCGAVVLVGEGRGGSKLLFLYKKTAIIL